MLIMAPNMCLLCRGMPDIQWMNLDPVKLMEELSQFTSLEGFKEMLDKAQVRHRNVFIYGLNYVKTLFLISLDFVRY